VTPPPTGTGYPPSSGGYVTPVSAVGFGISKLAAKAGRLLGVDTTARNWRTVGKLLELAKG
jgi:hypothetical protein